jgi:checkpoint serine/threonine-protein kinase
MKEQITVNPRTGRNERIFVNLEAVYPTPEQTGTEQSFEELRAASRGWLLKTWKSQKTDNPVINAENKDERVSYIHDERSSVVPVGERIAVALEGGILDENGVARDATRPGRSRKLKTMEVNETQISKWIRHYYHW